MYLGTAGFIACIVSGRGSRTRVRPKWSARTVLGSLVQGSIVSLLTGGQDPRKLPKNVLFPIIDRQFKRYVPENPYEESADGKENSAYEDTDKL